MFSNTCFKQSKSLSFLLSKPKIQNPISEKYGLFPYQCKYFRCNLCASYIQECLSFETSKGYNWKVISGHANCHSMLMKNVMNRDFKSE